MTLLKSMGPALLAVSHAFSYNLDGFVCCAA